MRSNRRGFTLIELMVYTALLAIVLTVVCKAIVAATESMRFSQRRAAMRSAALLALDAFKNDARAATSARLDAPGALTLVQAAKGRTVRYELRQGAVVRLVAEKGASLRRRWPLQATRLRFRREGSYLTMIVDLPPAGRRSRRGQTLAAAAAMRLPEHGESKR